MIAVGVAQLKARLSEYLGRVRGGPEILVTEHGRPIASMDGPGLTEALLEERREGR